MENTKGEWKVYQDNMACIIDVVAEDGMGFFSNVVAHINLKNDNAKANANLICEAVNACKEINPDNPLKVAQSIEELVEACNSLPEPKSILSEAAYTGGDAPKKWMNDRGYFIDGYNQALKEVKEHLNPALAKAESK